MQEFHHTHLLVFLRPDFLPETGKSFRRDLDLGHPRQILEGHPQAEIARHFKDEQRLITALERGQGLQPLQVKLRVAAVLVVDQFPDPQVDHFPGRGGETRHPGQQRLSRGGGGLGQLECRLRRRVGLRILHATALLPGQFIAAREGQQVAFHGNPALANSLLKHLPAEGQHARLRQGPEQGGVDDAVEPAGGFQHIETDIGPGPGARHLDDGLLVHHAPAHGLFLGDTVDTVGGGDKGGAVRRHEAALYHAPRLDDFRADDDIHVPGRGEHGHDRQPARRLGLVAGKNLYVVDGGAGALGHAGYRGGLAEVTLAVRHVGNPLGQHAPTLATQGGHHNANSGGHSGCNSRARRSRCCRKPITASRTRPTSRSQGLGLYNSSALAKEGHKTALWTLEPHTPQPTQLLST